MGYTTGISNKFFLTIMFCLFSVSKNSKIIQSFMFSEIVRPKMSLIDPSPLNSSKLLWLSSLPVRMKKIQSKLKAPVLTTFLPLKVYGIFCILSRAANSAVHG